MHVLDNSVHYTFLNVAPFFYRDFDTHACVRIAQSECTPVKYKLRNDEDYVHQHFSSEANSLAMLRFCVEEKYALAGKGLKCLNFVSNSNLVNFE